MKHLCRYASLVIFLKYVLIPGKSFAGGTNVWFAIDRLVEIETNLAMKVHSSSSKSFPNIKANLLSPHQLASEFLMIQSELEDKFEQGDIYASQVLAWMCKKGRIDDEDKICLQANAKTLPLHRNFGAEIQDSLDAYLNVFSLPMKGQLVEMGGGSTVRVISATSKKNLKKISGHLKKKQKNRQNSLDLLNSFMRGENPFAEYLLGNIAWETSGNLEMVESLYRISATHPFPLGMKAYKRFCSVHPEHCTIELVKKKASIELALLEQDPSGRIIAIKYQDTTSTLYQLRPEKSERFRSQWTLYRHLYGTGDSMAMVNYYHINKTRLASELSESQQLEEAVRWLNHAINYQFNNFEQFYNASQEWTQEID